MKNSLDAFIQKANSVSLEDLKNSIKGGISEDCHCVSIKEHVPTHELGNIIKYNSYEFETSLKKESSNYSESFDLSSGVVTFE